MKIDVSKMKLPERGENDEQIAFFDWAKHQYGLYPHLRMMYHPANFAYGHVFTTMQNSRMGVNKGVPDVVLPVSRCGYYGLYIENKVGRNYLADEQVKWFEDLRSQGSLCLLSYSPFDLNSALVIAYLEGRKDDLVAMNNCHIEIMAKKIRKVKKGIDLFLL